ncbi:MAG: magnesium chelatase subunit D [Hyphomicrobium sp.]
MPSDRRDAAAAWECLVKAAALAAVDPLGTGGVALSGRAGPVRDAWLALVRDLLPEGAPLRRVPLGIGDDRLLGGLDLAATLSAGRPVAERGLLAEADGGAVVLVSAERLDLGTVVRITRAMDERAVAFERDGLTSRLPAAFGVIALDEGMDDEQRPAPGLLDRLAFRCDSSGIGLRDAAPSPVTRTDVAAARERLSGVTIEDDAITALCVAAVELGIASLRAPLLALSAARAAAALDGRSEVDASDLEMAAALVLAPRATRIPAPEDDASEQTPDDPPPPDPGPESEADDPEREPPSERELQDMIIAAAAAAIPPDVLKALRLADSVVSRSRTAGKSGAALKGRGRGRPQGTRAGKPGGGKRLELVETLRTAAPWQTIRKRERQRYGHASAMEQRLEIRGSDLRVQRTVQRTETATIFVVDASGSSALHRLAEAKGAIELLLADCYVRRDSVALISFRGKVAELLLPPTRSLARAKRSLAGLPGGGATPLAAGVDEARELALAIRRKGQTPHIVLLTDGRANITRDGKAGRAAAENEALAAAKALRIAGLSAVLIDTSPHRQAQAERLAEALGGPYVPLPYADAATLSRTVRSSIDARRS